MLHYQTKEEYQNYPENVKKGCAGMGMHNVAAFIAHCPDLIAVHWTCSEVEKNKHYYWLKGCYLNRKTT